MKYRDDILENKEFNLFKQLMYNIALAICIMLIGVLILTYGFKYKLYVVETGSEEPFLPVGCMVVVKAQDEYEVGDIIKFDVTGYLPTTHRLVAIYTNKNTGKKYYICHGDNVQNADGTYCEVSGWEDDRDFIQGLIDADTNITLAEIKNLASNIQTPTFDQIEGKVVNHINNFGSYFQFIQDHYMLLIALIAGIWCVSGVIQNEIDIKKCRRLI